MGNMAFQVILISTLCIAQIKPAVEQHKLRPVKML
jgi:hypothetical protein